MNNQLNNRPIYLYITLILSVTIITSCKSNEDSALKVIDHTNPYAEAFWGKNVKYIITKNDVDGTHDTIGFDLKGNINYVREYGFVNKSVYNDGHFITRDYRENSGYYNNIIFYQQKSDSITQFWVNLNHLKWNLSAADSISSQDTSKVIFKINRAGQIISKNYGDGSLEILTYKDGLLVKSEYKGGKTIYFYKDHKLKHIEIYREQNVDAIHYFNDKTGLLDSTVMKSADRKLEYDYYYY